jgi:ABC-type sugar transport system permease subunit
MHDQSANDDADVSTVSGNQAAAARQPPRLGFSTQWLLLLPSIVLVLAINVYPIVSGVLFSFQEGSLMRIEGWVGLENFARLVRLPEFWRAATFTVAFTLASVLGSLLVGLGLALALVRIQRGQTFFRVAFMLSWIIPSVVGVIAFRWMVTDSHGIANVILDTLGVGPVYFLAAPDTAAMTLVVLKVWRTFPFLMLILLAARQGVPTELYDAGAIDGAGRWQAFRHITTPAIRGVVIVGCLLVTIWTVNDFETIWLLTRGGPSDATQTLLIAGYRYTFFRNDVGIGAALGVVSLVALLALAFVLLRLLDRDRDWSQ